MPPVTKVLIANRGEIAVRLARAVRAESAVPIGVASADEPEAPHTRATEDVVVLPGSGPAGYLDVAAVVTAAVEHGCDAVHPGYGFLSERADFAKACLDAGLIFVGPTPAQLDRFGDKDTARRAAVDAGLPVLDASGVVDRDGAAAFVDAHGPSMLKAVSGGGGRGMRPVRPGDDIAAAFASATREAESAFGDGRIFVEEMLPGARHVEVQIVGDGNRVEHLHERECSIQRARQKLVEFAPAWWLTPAMRARLHDLAVQLGESVHYRSLGTVEFLVAGDRIAFLECNPRLQVEHTVTEAVTGLDLVRLQLRIAGGATLSALDLFAPPAVSGFAVQARVAAETVDPAGRPLPVSGTFTRFDPPKGHRTDTATAVGDAPNARFDSLVAKLVVHTDAPDRLLADAAAALDEFAVDGVPTNRAVLARVLRHDDVRSGTFDTTWFESHLDELVPVAERQAATDDDADGASDASRSTDGHRAVVAPLQGTVVEVPVAAGDQVAAGAVLVVIEAMKMEHVVVSPGAGVISEVMAVVGSAVGAGDVVAVVHTTGDVKDDAPLPEDAVDLDAIRADLAHVRERHAHGLDEHRPDAVTKRRKLGKRTARENVADLVDDGSFIEYGALVVAAQRKRRSLDELREKTPGDGLVGGLATVGGRPVAVASYDYTVLAGTQGLNNHRKKDRLFEVAAEQRLPFVFFTEGGGGRPGDTDGTGVAGLDCLAFAYFGRLSGLVPLVGIASGRCFAGNAAILGCCDVVIATADANIGMGGPAMIEGGGLGVYAPEDVGPIEDQIASGVVDIAVADEAEAVAVAQQYLGYFTEPVRPVPDDDALCADQRLLRHVVPENRLRVYDVRRVVDTLFDTDSVLELRRGFGHGMVTALARIDGRAVGVVANNPEHLAGAIDSDGADKAARFLQLCDAHDLPVVFLCDTPGIMVGPEAERTGLVRHAARLFVTAGGLTVPYLTVVLRKGYGLGAQAMAGGSFHSPIFIVGWPTSEFGGMGLEGAVRLGYRNELAAIDDPEERERTFQEMVDRMYEIGKGTSMAAAFEIDDVIDPADTRRWITAGLRAAPAPLPRAGKKRPNVDTW